MLKDNVKKELSIYTINTHRHTFSAWCASTAAGASPKCRFRVEEGFKVLSKSRISCCSLDIELSRLNHSNFDQWHRTRCLKLMRSAKESEISGFSYGVAAKMLNCYIKAAYLTDLEKYPFIHPPIDRLLLSELRKKNFDQKRSIWGEYEKLGWSNYTQLDYEALIKEIKDSLSDISQLWKIEFYWSGYGTEVF